MEVKQFFELLNEIKYVADYDEIIGSGLRAMVSKYYSVFKEIYNGLCNAGVLEESKQSTMKLTESDINYIVMEATKKIVEVHGSKKHNMPKDKYAAQRKGNRDAEKDIYGDGFKTKNKIHNVKGYSRKNNKISYDDMIDESVSKTLKEFIMSNEPSTDYEGNDLNFNSIVDQAVSIIYNMQENGENIRWQDVAENMGFRLETLNEEDMELLHDAIEHAMALPGIEEENNIDEI